MGYWILTSGGGFPTRQNEIAIIVQLLKLDLPSRETHIENYVKSYFSLTWVSILRLWCQYKHYLVASRDENLSYLIIRSLQPQNTEVRISSPLSSIFTTYHPQYLPFNLYFAGNKKYPEIYILPMKYHIVTFQ